ncbi:CobW family GTP-binding protein [Billgrantia endophytica]|nr:GTP-binding protein [Halomonas endophytica]
MRLCWEGGPPPMPEPAPIDTLLLCGFLGSGKTTRINQLIRAGRLRNALFLINDFGTLNIDAEWIDAREDGVLRLNNGCACCGISGNLSAQLTEIRRWPGPPECLVLEASGVARPRPLMQLFDAARGYRLGRADTLVDLSAIRSLLDDDAVGDIVHDQLRDVGHILVSRYHAMPGGAADAALERIKAINPHARVDWLPPVAPPCRRQVSRRAMPSWPDFARLAKPASSIVSRTVHLDAPVDIERLESLLDAARVLLLRAKGMLRSHDAPADMLAVQWTAGELRLSPLPSARHQALVLIGKGEPGLDALVTCLETAVVNQNREK